MSRGDAAGSDALVAAPFRGLEGLRSTVEAWRELLPETDADPLFNSSTWTLAHAASFATGDTLFGWTLADSSGAPAAVFPFRREPKRGPLALRRAILAADGTFDSDYLDLPIRPGLERAALAALLDQLTATRGIEAVVFAGLPADSPCLAPLRDLLRERGLRSRESPVTCLATPLPGSFEELLQGLNSRMRSKVRAALRAYDERGATLTWCDSRERLEPDLNALFELHGLRWRAAGQDGSFVDAGRRRLYTELAEQYLPNDGLRFAHLEVDGRAVATQFGLRLGTTYYQLQEGFHPEHEKLRAGIALRAMALRALLAEGVTRYDFLAGDAQHKRDWGAREQPCVTLTFALPNMRARAAYGLRALLGR